MYVEGDFFDWLKNKVKLVLAVTLTAIMLGTVGLFAQASTAGCNHVAGTQYSDTCYKSYEYWHPYGSGPSTCTVTVYCYRRTAKCVACQEVLSTSNYEVNVHRNCGQ